MRFRVRERHGILPLPVVATGALLALAACSGGSARDATVSSFAEPVGVAVPANPPRRKGLFAGLRAAPKPPEPPLVIAVPDPQNTGLIPLASPSGSPSMTDAEIAAAGVVAATPNPAPRRGLFGFLGKRPRGEDPTIIAAPPPEAFEPVLAPVPSMTDAEIAAAGVVEDAPEPSRRPRLFGFLNKRTPGDVASPAAPVVVAAAPPAAAELPPEDPAPRRGGWPFGRARDAAEPELSLPIGPLPFGEVLRVCGVKKRDMGTEVARSQGAGYRLYDTNPAIVEPRTQYLTGFKDGCARQFTASLALFGAPAVHEATRYGAANKAPYTSVDTAYEKVKNRICGVKRGQPCPPERAGKLESQTAFVTIYPRFGGAGEWVEVFLHKGQLVTYETRSP